MDASRHRRPRRPRRADIEIIRTLFTGNYVNYAGNHYRVDCARLWDVGAPAPDIAVAVSGAQSARIAGELADAMIAIEPDAQLGKLFDRRGGTGKRRIGQVPSCWDPNRDRAVERAHSLFRWFGGGWKVNAEHPGPAAFQGASQFLRTEGSGAMSTVE